jgi:L-asparaginase
LKLYCNRYTHFKDPLVCAVSCQYRKRCPDFALYYDAHREEVLRACVAAKGERIVVTHGTDTMEVTARYLGERVKGQTIVLTGAMVPYTFGSSDGLFNLGSALAFAQSMPEGVYVAMNGRCFDWNNVRKNRETGRFVESSAS